MTIEEMALKTYPVNEIGVEDCSLDLAKIPRRAYIKGANAVLEEIENFMKDLDLGNSAEEKFYKLDVLADISSFIEQLKK